jgi:hypothetical protein
VARARGKKEQAVMHRATVGCAVLYYAHSPAAVRPAPCNSGTRACWSAQITLVSRSSSKWVRGMEEMCVVLRADTDVSIERAAPSSR